MTTQVRSTSENIRKNSFHREILSIFTKNKQIFFLSYNAIVRLFHNNSQTLSKLAQRKNKRGPSNVRPLSCVSRRKVCLRRRTCTRRRWHWCNLGRERCQNPVRSSELASKLQHSTKSFSTIRVATILGIQTQLLASRLSLRGSRTAQCES